MASRKAVRDFNELILAVRGQRVILDSDLASLYGVPTGRLNEQVKRNIDRFPTEFAFPLTRKEVADLRSQIAISVCMADAAICLTSSPRNLDGSERPEECCASCS